MFEAIFDFLFGTLADVTVEAFCGFFGWLGGKRRSTARHGKTEKPDSAGPE